MGKKKIGELKVKPAFTEMRGIAKLVTNLLGGNIRRLASLQDILLHAVPPTTTGTKTLSLTARNAIIDAQNRIVLDLETPRFHLTPESKALLETGPPEPLLPKPLVLQEGFTLRWVRKENLLFPVPAKSKCQGCYVRNAAIIDYFENRCINCASKNNVLVIPDRAVLLSYDTPILKNEHIPIVLLQKIDSSTEITYPHMLLLENYKNVLRYFRRAYLKSAKDRRTVVLVWRVDQLAQLIHANAIILRINALSKTVNVRVFDPHSEKGPVTEAAQSTENGLRYLMPLLLSYMLPGTQVEFDFGESCPVGLQTKEWLNGHLQLRIQAGLEGIQKALPYLKSLPLLSAKAGSVSPLLITPEQLIDLKRIVKTYDTNIPKATTITRPMSRVEQFALVTNVLNWDKQVRVASAQQDLERQIWEDIGVKTKYDDCKIIPGGYCEAWTALLILLQLVFPDVSTDDIIRDVYRSFPKYIPRLEDSIARFSYNLYIRTANPELRRCCGKNDIHVYPHEECPQILAL